MVAIPQVSSVMRCLADPTRLAIYHHIVSESQASVGELTQHAGVSQPAVSQHLSTLKKARLIKGLRAGRNVFYEADPRGLKPLAEWLRYHERLWNQRFDRLGDYIQELKAEEKHDRKNR